MRHNLDVIYSLCRSSISSDGLGRNPQQKERMKMLTIIKGTKIVTTINAIISFDDNTKWAETQFIIYSIYSNHLHCTPACLHVQVTGCCAFCLWLLSDENP